MFSKIWYSVSITFLIGITLWYLFYVVQNVKA